MLVYSLVGLHVIKLLTCMQLICHWYNYPKFQWILLRGTSWKKNFIERIKRSIFFFRKKDINEWPYIKKYFNPRILPAMWDARLLDHQNQAAPVKLYDMWASLDGKGGTVRTWTNEYNISAR
jgi:hypothetical protein